MSFLTIEDNMARDLWPRMIGRPIDEDLPMEGLEDWQLMPVTFDGVCDSIEIIGAGKDSTGANRHRLVYKTRLDREGKLCEVCIRIQGVVHSSRIGPLGDWNGVPSGCPRATQKLALEGGIDDSVFGIQVGALDNIKTFIYRALRSRPAKVVGSSIPSNMHENPDFIIMERRVFTKVRPTSVGMVSELERADDPDGLAKKIEKQWIVDHRIGYALQSEDGSRKACNHLAIRQGDFVDVGITFDVFTRYMKGKRMSIINFAVQDILRLATASELESIRLRRDSESLPFNSIEQTLSGLKAPVVKVETSSL